MSVARSFVLFAWPTVFAVLRAITVDLASSQDQCLFGLLIGEEEKLHGKCGMASEKMLQKNFLPRYLRLLNLGING